MGDTIASEAVGAAALEMLEHRPCGHPFKTGTPSACAGCAEESTRIARAVLEAAAPHMLGSQP